VVEPARDPPRPLGPHAAGREHDDGEEETHGALAPREDPERPHFALPLAAMAEALRANAEALRRIDSNQRKIADSIEKGEKATRLIASTRNLNETFRNLGEIQRGLLDALVRTRGGVRGVGWILLTGILLALVLGWLLGDRFGGRDDAGTTTALADARGRVDALTRDLEAARDEARRQEAADGAWHERFDSERKRTATLQKEAEEATARISELQEELAGKEASLKEYLSMKDIADQTGQVMTRNAYLEQEAKDLRERLTHSEKERERILGLLADAKLDAMEGDPEAILRAAEAKGVIEPPAGKADATGGPAVLTARDRRVVMGQVNRLLRQAVGDDSWELLDFSAIDGGTRLLEARLGRYRDAVLVGTVLCAGLELYGDAGRDTLEMRLFDGSIVNTSRPGERIPLAEGGHSIYLREVGLQDWLRRSGGAIELGADGRLTWRTPPP